MSGLPCNNTTTNKQGYHYWWDNVAGGGTDGGGSISSSLSNKLTREESLRLEEENQKVKGSKWNAAQTFEERSYLAWAEKELNEILERMCGDANGWKIGIKESKGDMHGWSRFLLKMSVKKLTGNCSVVLSRGKMKHGLDLEATEFEMKASYMKGDLMNGEMTAVEGTFQVPEISIETIEDDEIEITERKAKEPKQPKDETEKKALKQDCELLMKDLKMLVTDACKILLGRLAEKANE
jgi:hypothetical protein